MLSLCTCFLFWIIISGTITNVATGPLNAANDLLYQRHAPTIHTRAFSYENRDGLKGQGGKARFGRKGSPAPLIKPGETFVFINAKGSGTIRHMWGTINKLSDPTVLRGVRVEMYWDGAKTPAVQAPLGDFFCQPLGKVVQFENALFTAPDARPALFPYRHARRHSGFGGHYRS